MEETASTVSAIDAATAWDIIQAARRIPPDTVWKPTSWLEIHPGGAWSASRAISPEATGLFDMLLPVAFSAQHYVIAQIGQSLDGRIATACGHSRYVTGRASRVHLHRLRALVDAVIIGANTAITDNPRLTVRHIMGESPARVVLDPNGRVLHDLTLFTDGGPTTWHAVRDPAAAAPGAQPLTLPPEAAHIPGSLLATLAQHGLHRILVEGGGTTISRFLQAGCIDRLHVVVAPFLIGSGRPSLALDEIKTLDQALRPACRSYDIGDDRLYDLNLHQPSDSPHET